MMTMRVTASRMLQRDMIIHSDEVARNVVTDDEDARVICEEIGETLT